LSVEEGTLLSRCVVCLVLVASVQVSECFNISDARLYAVSNYFRSESFSFYWVGNSGVPRIFFLRGWFSPGIFFGGGVQQIQLMTEGRENGDLGAVAP
jgi:hypothetical protein